MQRPLYLFNKGSNIPLWSFRYYVWGIDSLDISANGEYIVTSTEEGKIYFLHKSSNIPIWEYDVGDKVHSLGISDNGKYVVAGSDNHNIYLFINSIDENDGTSNGSEQISSSSGIMLILITFLMGRYKKKFPKR